MRSEGAGSSREFPPRERFPALAHYELLQEIASGGMATVYLGRKRGVGGFERLVAIKCCHPHLRRDPAFVTMFLDEARLAARIHHPNVVATLDVGDDEALYFVMDYVEGTSLAEWVARLAALDRRIPPALLLRVMTDGLAGLHAAHELRDQQEQPLCLVHRDISPQNILVGLDGVSRIVDFGIAKAESRATRTRTGQVKGKTGYMCPEQILGEPLDRRVDIYAAGVVLWEALTGRRLFEGNSDAATINLVLCGRIAPPSTLCDAPAALDPIVLRALAFAPDQRFENAAEFGRALERSGLAIASTGAVGEAIRELFSEGILPGRVRVDGRGTPPVSSEPAPAKEVSLPPEDGLAASPVAPSRALSNRSRVGWVAAAVAALGVGFFWRLWVSSDATSETRLGAPRLAPSPALPGPSAARSAASVPMPDGVAHPEATLESRQKARIAPLSPSSRTRSHGVPAASPGPARLGKDSVLPQDWAPAVAARPSAAPARPRSPPSEFRPPDL